MWEWPKRIWNYFTGGNKPAAPPPYVPPAFTPPPNTLPLKGNIWVLDPQTHIATRMVAVADPNDKMHGFKLVSTGEQAVIPQSGTHLENRPVVDTAKVARDRAKLAADIKKFQFDLSHNADGRNNAVIAADRAQIENDKKQLMADLHPAPRPTYVLNPMPAPGTLVNGIPVFQRRAGHLVATIDAGHGVSRYTAKPNQPITPQTTIAYDPGSKSVGGPRTGSPVTEDVINLHFSQDAAVAFARNGWDTIITRGSNEPRFAGRGFGHRIDAANQADVYISLHADQRLGDPNKDPAARERLAVQAKAEALRAQGGDLSKLSAHEKAVLQDIAGKTGVRVYIDRRVGVDDHSLAFGRYLDTPHSRGDMIQDGFVRRPGNLMIDGEKIRRPLSVLLEPGAIDIANDEAHMRSRNYRQAFAQRLVDKTEIFYQQCLPALRSGQTQPAQCTTPVHDPSKPAPAAAHPQPSAPAPQKIKASAAVAAAHPAQEREKPAHPAKPPAHPKVPQKPDHDRHPAKHVAGDHPTPPSPTPHGKKPPAPAVRKH